MKKKIKIGIIAIICLLLAGIVLISGYIQKKPEQEKSEQTSKKLGEMPIKSATPIFYSNMVVDSDSKAQQVFNENFEEIIDAIKTKLREDDYFIKYYSSGLKLTCIENNIFLSDYTKFEKRKFEHFSSCWIEFEKFDKEQYTFITPIAPKDKEWKYENEKVLIKNVRCKEMPSGQTISSPVEMLDATYDELKEYFSAHCKKGITETFEPFGYNLKFIMDYNGTVYLAGGYCPK